MADLFRMIAKSAFPEFRGRKIHVRQTGTVTFSDLNWSGGTRSWFVALQTETGRTNRLAVPAPWANPVEGKTVEIPQGVVVVEKSVFCGGSPSITLHFSKRLEALPAPALPAGA